MTETHLDGITTRNASLTDMAELLRDQHARKADIVAPASAVRAENGQLVIADTEPTLSPEGVTSSEGRYTPTDTCDLGIADKLGIPATYLRKLRSQHPGLYDDNINGWLRPPGWRSQDGEKRYLVRCLRGENGGGVARAYLSDGYRIIDNLDVLMAALDGVREAGHDVSIDGCDLTERRMYVRVRSEHVAALAPQLLANYRSPFTGASGADNPVVFAGFVISNSETGFGAFSLTPRLVIQVCDNGMTIPADALRAVHLGSRLDEGVIQWSDDTQQRNLSLVTAQARDAVTTFLDRDYVERYLARIAEAADTPVNEPEETVRTVSQRLRFTENQQNDILNHFIKGGTPTAGGVMQAVTSAAQLAPNGDDAAEMEAHALRALDLAAAQ